jgi:hypothetical protein
MTAQRSSVLCGRVGIGCMITCTIALAEQQQAWSVRLVGA